MRTLTLTAFLLTFTPSLHAAVQTKVIEYKQGDQVLEGYLAWDDAVTGRGRACSWSMNGPAWATMPRCGPGSWPNWATSPLPPTSTAKASGPPRRRRRGPRPGSIRRIPS